MEIRLSPVVHENHIRFIHEQAQKEENAEFFRRMQPYNTWPANTLAWWSSAFIVEQVEGEKPLGLLAFANIDSQNRNLEFGLMLDKEACAPLSRREVAVHALTQMLDYVFEYLQYEKIYSKTLAHRDAVFSGYEQYGFTKDGVLRSNVWFRNELRDEVVYSLLRHEWLDRKKT